MVWNGLAALRPDCSLVAIHDGARPCTDDALILATFSTAEVHGAGVAAQRVTDTLKEAGVDRAGSLILSSSGMIGSAEVIRLARELNPAIRVLARSAYVRDLPALQKAGSEVVISGEGEVALALTEAILRRLGATPEQIDRERERVRIDLVAGDRGAYSRDNDVAPMPLIPPEAGGL